MKTIDWSIEKADLKDGLLQVRIKNKGNAHITISRMDVIGKDENDKDLFSKEISGGKILANNSRNHFIEIPPANCLKTRTLSVTVGVEGEVIKTELNVDKSMCNYK